VPRTSLSEATWAELQCQRRLMMKHFSQLTSVELRGVSDADNSCWQPISQSFTAHKTLEFHSVEINPKK